MQAKITQSATARGRAVILVELELELGAPPLYVVVLHLPRDARGRSQDWTRSETELDDALALYGQTVTEHVQQAAAG